MTHAPASLPRLSAATLTQLPAAIVRPGYDPAATRIGIVHLGAGAFHRAHQAAYIDALLGEQPDWGICAVSLHNPQVRDALRPQDGLYTLALLDEAPQLRIIGAIREVLCGGDEPAAVLARLADPDVRLVTLTVTEKGYCLLGDTLDLDHPDIVHDLAHPASPRSAIGYLVAGLRTRWQHGTAPFTVLSCDNLTDNGHLLRAAVQRLAQQHDPALAQWIQAQVSFPCSMVDSITPASDDALRARVQAQIDLDDAWPIQRERYSQWVIEDRFCNGRPALERVGVTFSDDIAGYARAKLRLLNGPHSALAYLGSLLGLTSVAEAMRHPQLAPFVQRLMQQDIAPTLPPLAGFDAQGYSAAILARFANPAIDHRLAQIAWDGSQKLPVRLFGTLRDAMDAGRPIDRLCLPVAAWLHFVRRQAHADVALVDPLADALHAVGRAANGQAEHDLPAFLGLDAVFAPVRREAHLVTALTAAYRTLGDGSASAVEAALAASAQR
ncbi:mannitol dehydrogenase family protein [Xanthomonas maliensis]|uniref:mannitol dehydrogenase family protein n=1 Tax=Xanthomonas maliensis TaxID=1321368 RepID=UPI00039E9112|nr:mannitol dehydrogenase family protein [Xanthomonas maliensis]KAB7763188.1 mannitol dehydrogenase family protein [Xanthomonas maliensis]